MKSKVAYLLSLLLMVYASLFCPRWEKQDEESTLGWDVSGYYWYLPSVFVYHDLKHQKFGDSLVAKYHPTPDFAQAFRYEGKNYVITYSSGMAFMYFPFFLIAHLVANPLGYPPDGFSLPYMFAISMGSLLIAFVGLWYFRKLLLYYYSDSTTALVLLLLVFGTNYLNYTAIDGALTHNWLFTLYVFLLLNTRLFYQTLKMKYALAIGLLCGFLILIRPSEIISILVPLLWGMERVSKKEIGNKLQFLKIRWRKIAVAGICVIAIGSIQLFYWKYVSGHWLVYSYQEKGFSWLHPHFRDYIFSYRSGWLTYTPMVIFIFAGLFYFIRTGKNKVAILSFFAINLYIVSAWDIWWYGGTGGRAMIQSYPILLFPLASFLEYLLKQSILKWVLAPVFLLFIYFNLWFTYQAHGGEGLYDPEGMSKAYYWRVAGRWHAEPEIRKLKDTDELFEGQPQHMHLIYQNDFEQDSSLLHSPLPAIEGNRSIYLNKQHNWSNTYSLSYAKGKSTWIRAQATFRLTQKEWTNWLMTQFIAGFSAKGATVKERMIRVHRFMDNGETKDLYIDIKVPDAIVDSIHVKFWNVESDKPILIDNLKVWEFQEK